MKLQLFVTSVLLLNPKSCVYVLCKFYWRLWDLMQSYLEQLPKYSRCHVYSTVTHHSPSICNSQEAYFDVLFCRHPCLNLNMLCVVLLSYPNNNSSQKCNLPHHKPQKVPDMNANVLSNIEYIACTYRKAVSEYCEISLRRSSLLQISFWSGCVPGKVRACRSMLATLSHFDTYIVPQRTKWNPLQVVDEVRYCFDLKALIARLLNLFKITLYWCLRTMLMAETWFETIFQHVLSLLLFLSSTWCTYKATQ